MGRAGAGWTSPIAIAAERTGYSPSARLWFQGGSTFQRFCKYFLFFADMSVCSEHICMPIYLLIRSLIPSRNKQSLNCQKSHDNFIIDCCHRKASHLLVAGWLEDGPFLSYPSDAPQWSTILRVSLFQSISWEAVPWFLPLCIPPGLLCHMLPHEKLKQGHCPVGSIFNQLAELGRSLPARQHLWSLRSAQDLGCWCPKLFDLCCLTGPFPSPLLLRIKMLKTFSHSFLLPAQSRE